MTQLGSGQDLVALLASRVPIVVMETRDEARALGVVGAAAASAGNLPVFRWTVTEGLARQDVHLGPQRFNTEPADVLNFVRGTDLPGVYVLVDFHPYLDDPRHVRLLKDIGQGYGAVPRTVVLVSHAVPVPVELEHLVARLTVAVPDRVERATVVDRAIAEASRHHGGPLVVDPHARDLLVENLGGLSIGEAERLARGAVADGALVPADLPVVMQAKYQLLNRGGVLRYEHDVPDVADLGGMAALVRWLGLRRAAFDGSGAGLEPPRGVLLVGVQGCGKSMAAKVAAGVFGVPLLHLDLAAVHNKYVGESERILRETLATADVLAPCVVWVDEVEKALADDESGAARRVLGTLLTWLAERRSSVFVVATANDVSALPPELVRKGRFDELFFVDLPDAAARAHILRVHAARRGLVLDEAQAALLADASAGFSGAELEHAVVSARYAAYAGGGAVTADHVLGELRATRPLSVVMAERIAALRAWATGRTVPAAG
ncbi:AAA family ATPase [Actinotalea sp. M2MS4P-6]|uniref:AAA family ATPase n=1 Tax=Actinotalea sp. M2MS4P-6 TaxID=2983762 RepID=UPI0021E3F814|nr:AAA family ATPase [Actinotalea sp. M2MS4P-6]MCV2395286.1 AAA family ATPase [Actinotalea sp. M2MS4P-6]